MAETAQGRPEIRVEVEVMASESECAAVEDAFAKSGFPNQPVIPIVGGPGGVSAVEILVFGPLAAFLVAFATEAGKDAYLGLKAFVSRVGKVESERGSFDELLIWDERQIHLWLRTTEVLSDEAIEKLSEIEWSEVEDSSWITWDAQLHEWRIRRR